MGRRRRARVGVATATSVLAVLACGTALAYFSTTGSGAVNAGLTSLGKTTITAATPAVGGTVTLTWSAVTPPSTGSVTYYVTRDGGAPAGTCPSAAAPTTVTTCVDKGVEPGTHSYVVTAKWRSWTSSSSPASATVTVGAATHLVLSAASTTPAAGASDNLTISARDSAESIVTTYTGSHNITFSGASASPGGTAPTVSNASGTAIAFGTATALTFTNGVATVTTTKNGVMKLYRAEATNVSASDGTISTATPLALTVVAAALSKLVLAAETTAPITGAADDLTISAQDTYGNRVPTYEGTREMTFSGASASPNGTQPTVTDVSGQAVAFGTATTIDFDAGLASTSGSENGEMRLYKTGATSVKVSDGSLTSAVVTVTPVSAAASKFALTASTLTPVAGASVNLTMTAQETYGNTATTYTGSHNITFSGASASPGGTAPTVSNASGTAIAFGTATALTFTNGVATVTTTKNGVMKLYRAEATNVSASDGTISTATPVTFTVATAAISKFTLGVETTAPAVGEADSLTITAQDTYANSIVTYTGSHNLTFSGASASPSGALPTVTNSSGEAIAFGTATAIAFSAGVAVVSGGSNGVMRLYKSAAASVKVTEGAISSATVTVTPTVGTATKFVLGASTLTPAAGASVNLTTTAQDTYGNTATTYTGSHNITFSGASTSAGGTVPTVVNSAGTAVAFGGETALTFTAGVAAVASSKNGLMKLYKAEAASLTASDGTVATAAPLTVTVAAIAASKLALTGVTASAGSLSVSCYFTCTVSGLGNSGTIKAKVAVTDTYGNVISNLGSGHSVTVTTSTGTISGGALTIASAGAAESSTQFQFTAPSSGNFTATITAATSAGTVYTSATITANK